MKSNSVPDVSTLSECQFSCESDATCTAFEWYPNTKGYDNIKCHRFPGTPGRGGWSSSTPTQGGGNHLDAQCYIKEADTNRNKRRWKHQGRKGARSNWNEWMPSWTSEGMPDWQRKLCERVGNGIAGDVLGQVGLSCGWPGSSSPAAKPSKLEKEVAKAERETREAKRQTKSVEEQLQKSEAGKQVAQGEAARLRKDLRDARRELREKTFPNAGGTSKNCRTRKQH